MFCDRYLKLLDKVVELDKVSLNMEMVSRVEMDKVRSELSIVQSEKVVLESKLVGYKDVDEEVSTLKAMIESLELVKIGLVDKIAMLEHVVQNLKGEWGCVLGAIS